jgi:CDP-glycerol glycerophosphotransferase (TagB/SpsB family)
VVAAKYTQIEPVFRDLVRVVGGMPGVQLVVKCHPAETAAPYEQAAAGVTNVRVADAGTDLARLVACADVLVTVNSTAAIEAMVLDVPALVLALPNNLSPFVEAGAMSGVVFGDAIEPALRAILYDQEYRERLRRGRRAFMEGDLVAPDGHAADRAAAAVVRLIRHHAAKKERACAH